MTNTGMLNVIALCKKPPVLFTFTKNVPMNDIIIPVPASTNGSNTADKPPKLSANPGTMKAAPSTIVPIIEPT